MKQDRETEQDASSGVARQCQAIDEAIVYLQKLHTEYTQTYEYHSQKLQQCV